MSIYYNVFLSGRISFHAFLSNMTIFSYSLFRSFTPNVITDVIKFKSTIWLLPFHLFHLCCVFFLSFSDSFELVYDSKTAPVLIIVIALGFCRIYLPVILYHIIYSI